MIDARPHARLGAVCSSLLRQRAWLGVAALGVALAGAGELHGQGTETPPEAQAPPITLGVRGWGSVHLRLQPGPLVVHLQKQDLNMHAGADQFVARLVGPDRSVVAETVLEDDGNAAKGGGAGPRQQATLSVDVPVAGLYKLDLEPRIGSESGTDIVWGFATSAPHYLIESPLLFRAEAPGNVYFMPRPGDIELTINPLGQKQQAALYDSEGQLVRQWQLDGKQALQDTVPGPTSRPERPWRLHLEKQAASVQIDGVTRFPGEAEDYYPNTTYWTDRADAWFPIDRLRWMLTPYHFTLDRLPGEAFEVVLTLRNGTQASAAYTLTTEAAAALALDPLPQRVELAPGETRKLHLRGTVRGGAPLGQALRGHVVAAYADSPAEAAHFTLTVRTQPPTVARTLEMPIVHAPYRHENALFGYAPDYIPNAPYFDGRNRPYIRWRDGHRHITTAIETYKDGQWFHGDFAAAIRQILPDFSQTHFAAHARGVKTAFDRDGDAYSLISVAAGGAIHTVLLHSSDGLASYQAYRLDAASNATFEIEQFTGHNASGAPPAILIYERTRAHAARWADYHSLKLYLPQKDALGNLTLGAPVRVSERAVGVAAHSGGASALASRDGKVHLVWGEVSEPGDETPGVPTYAATYDRATGQLGEPALIGYGLPANDVHNSPGITLDSRGYLHVLTGAHGQPFMYARSLKPNTAHDGWTDAVPALTSGRKDVEDTDGNGRGSQTYLGLVCDAEDTLHIVSRQWRSHVDDYFGGRLYAALSHQRKPADGPWEEPEVLVVPPLPDYSVFYHKLTIDRLGRLYVSYSLWSVHPSYRKDLPGLLDYQAVLLSGDGGRSWKLAETADFVQGIEAYAAP